MGATFSAARPPADAPELLAAKVKLLEAQAEASRKHAEAEAAASRTRAEADAAATRTHAEAETKRAEADAAAIRTHAEAEAAATRTHAEAEALRQLLPLAVGFSVASLLAVDFYHHESGSYLRRRMLAALRAPSSALSGVTKASLPTPQPLPVAQSRLVLGLLPTMILGPTGCGKSTLLASLARESAAVKAGLATPTVLVRMRLPSSQAPLPESTAPNTAAAFVEPSSLMNSLAAQVFHQIGFPTRRAVVLGMPEALKAQIMARLGVRNADFRSPSSQRLCEAFRILFDVLEQLCEERMSRFGLSREDAAPVLLLDEVHDLIKTSRLVAVGGRDVFNTLAQLLVMYCVDRRSVRAAVAGSSALLSVEFDRTVASGSRWYYYQLRDPEVTTMLQALSKSGYDDSQARELVELCGTRLRLLEPVLTRGAEVLTVREFTDSCVAMASQHYRDLFRELDDANRRILLDVLDRVEQAETGTGAPPTFTAKISEELVARSSKVLYLHLGGTFSFQSALHRNVWKRLRSEFTS